MSRTIILAILVVAAGVAAYFTWFSGPEAPSEQQIAAYAQQEAEALNEAGDRRIDDWSRYENGRATGMTLTRDIRSLMPAANLPDDYLENRRAMLRRTVCEDEAQAQMLAAGLVMEFPVLSSDDEAVGTITLGPDFCA